MNPVLLKPEGNAQSQVVVAGKSIGSMAAREYHEHKLKLREVVVGSLERLRANFDVVVIEGAGSPAEINLKDRDIVNMFVAQAADAPVLLAGDIDRGGIFAAFVGTYELLEAHERSRLCGFIINKFRGDRTLLKPGIDYMTVRTGLPTLGVVPYIPKLRIADEDSVSLDDRQRVTATIAPVSICVIRLPRISNFDDFLPLEHEPGVHVKFVERVDEAANADLLVIPGSKSTVADLEWLQEQGFADLIRERADKGRPVLGICGGCQMLGGDIHDPLGVESSRQQVRGLDLLPLQTRFAREKLTARVTARMMKQSFLCDSSAEHSELLGYEIHSGGIENTGDAAAFSLIRRNGVAANAVDGAVSSNGMVVGTMLHGIFENESVRQSTLRFLRRRRGLDQPAPMEVFSKEAEYDRLAAVVRDNLDLPAIKRAAKL